MSCSNLTDREWKSIRVFLPAERSGSGGSPWVSHRKAIDGILCVFCSGVCWKDVPAEFGTVVGHTHYCSALELPFLIFDILRLRMRGVLSPWFPSKVHCPPGYCDMVVRCCYFVLKSFLASASN